jgi:hypothetical protein
MSFAALGLSGCIEETADPVEREAKPTDARVVLKTEAYTDMGEGVFLIHPSRGNGTRDSMSVGFASNLATWKREHPERSINIMLPRYERLALDGAIIETSEKTSKPAE